MKVDVKGLSFNFGSKEILKNINLNVKNKEFVGIIGPNGSGKSTFLKCVYRVLNPPQGEIKINDKSIRTLSLKETAKYMAVVSQHNNNNFDFTVREMVLMGRSPHKKMMEQDNAYDYEIVEDSLRKVGMLDFVDRDFSTLSGGEQQRIVLARALTQQPKSLILDEPTNHLDIKYQLHLLDVVKKLDITSIAAFHDLNIAAMYCDTIYALKAGEIIDYGTPEKILTAKLIKELYQVNATIGKTKEGLINIIYTPLRNH